MLSRLPARFYGDFLMGSRLGAYRTLLVSALEAGYRVCSLGSLWRAITDGDLDPERRLFVLRHDVDTDPRTAEAMSEIDGELGIESSYLFRLSTAAIGIMARIADAGSEVSYHYEELSTIAKRRGLHDLESALAHLPEARDHFAENIRRLRAASGLPMRVVAAHGDFINRRLGLSNSVILADPAFRKAVDVDLDAYDDDLLRQLPDRFTDVAHPSYWEPADPGAAILAGTRRISVLVHPRHWRVDRWANARDDLRRVVEGLSFEVRIGGRRHS
jgi:hypothetical protein